jgi:hypothetical protein
VGPWVERLAEWAELAAVALDGIESCLQSVCPPAEVYQTLVEGLARLRNASGPYLRSTPFEDIIEGVASYLPHRR